MRKRERLRDLYGFPGFTPQGILSGVFGDSRARVVHLARRGKKRSAGRAGPSIAATTTGIPARSAIFRVRACGSSSASRDGGSPVGAAAA